MIPTLVETATRLAAELCAAEDAIATAVVAEVSADVPGPWQEGRPRAAEIEYRGTTVGVAWTRDGWTAYAFGPAVIGEQLDLPPADSPRAALAALEKALRRGSRPWRVAARAIVVRLRCGWAL
jgi:hypothetical protein